MKKIDEEGLKLCALQADIFAESLETTQCSSPIFIRRFMNSQVAARMDHRGFLLEASDAVSILNEVEHNTDRLPTEKNDTAGKNFIGWDTCIATGPTPMKRVVNRCISK